MLVNTRLWVGALFVMAVFFLPSAANAQIPGSFSTTWDTTLPGSSANNQVSIQYNNQGPALEVYWEDTASSSINGTTTIGFFANTITFPAPGIYRVDKPDFFLGSPFVANATGDQAKLLSVEQWGDDPLPTMRNMFRQASNFTSVPTVEAPDLSVAIDMSGTFSFTSFNQSINHWNVLNITNMRSLFDNNNIFDQPLDNWDVSNVSDFSNTFNGAQSFNQPLNDWDTSSATTTNSMFGYASEFNQPLDNWDTSNVENMAYMFYVAESFNQPVDTFDTSSVTNMNTMFGYAALFDQSLGSFDISNVTNMSSILVDTSISAVNYSDTLTSWSENSPIPTAITLGSVGNTGPRGSLTQYFSTAQAARDTLTNGNAWKITDGGSLAAFELTYGTTVNASLTGDGNQTVASGTPGTPVTVVPNDGFEFVRWSDGNTDNPRTDTPISSSVSVIAQVVQVAAGSGGSSGTRVGARQSDYVDVEPTKESTDRTVISSEGIAILNLSPEELKALPDEQKQQVIDILLKLIAILTEILTQMVVGEGT